MSANNTNSISQVNTENQQIDLNFSNRLLRANKTIKDLAAAPDIEYQMQRNEKAKELGLKVDTLDEYVTQARSDLNSEQIMQDADSAMFPSVLAWPEEVDIATVLNEIENLIRLYTVLDGQYPTAIALVFTWVHGNATVSPILNLTSPEKRCGKSTLLDVIESLVCKPLATGNITTAALYRSIEQWGPTLIIDEADTFIAGRDDMRGILNSGHYKSKAYVIRCDGDSNVAKRFTTWCPKVVAGIGELPETVMDRSIIVVMKRKRVDQNVESIRHKNEEAFSVISQKLKRWSCENSKIFKVCRPDRIKDINDRANDNWEPLLAIAQMAGGDWEVKAREAGLLISGAAEEVVSIGEQLLTDILDVFANRIDDKIQTAELIPLLCSDDEKPWATYHRGQNITPLVLGRMLKPFGISSRGLRFGAKVKRGFYQADFIETVSRYAPKNSATPATAATITTAALVE